MAVPDATSLPDDIELIYVGDPMCSWCWGFAPVLDRIAAHYAVPLRIVVGGLRPGPSAEVLDDRMRSFLAHHWEQVAERSGQPFDHAGLDRDGWVYDTELPARAVVTMRRMAPHDTLAFFTRLQRAFYAEAIDITSPAAYEPLLDEFPVDPGPFLEQLVSDVSKQEAWRDFSEARRLGVAGFPTLLIRLGAEHLVITRGYLSWEQLEPALSGWVRQRFGPETAAPLFCDLDGAC